MTLAPPTSRTRDGDDGTTRAWIADLEKLRRAQPQDAWERMRREFGGIARRADPKSRGELWRLRGHVLRGLRQAREAAVGPLEIWCTPEVTHEFFSDCHTRFSASLHRQCEGDLGLRMRQAMADGLTRARHVLLIGSDCGAHTFPYLEIRNTSSKVEHEASTSKIGEDQMFYCESRGISKEDAINMIVSGFCKEVFRELPMEFAVEAQKLLSVSLEGSVG